MSKQVKIEIDFEGMGELENELQRLSSIRLDAVRKKQTTEMFNRAKESDIPEDGGTPVDSGEMRHSLGSIPGERVGYTEEYAPHVEFGHRTRNNGYVDGQKFLYRNVEIQEENYKNDLVKQINKQKW